MLQVFLFGILGAAAATAVAAAHNRAPTRSRCPECAEATRILLLPPVLRRNEFVHLRWCPRCEWQGLGRKGPEWIPGRRLAHASGFHWGDERFQSDFGFEFRRIRPPAAMPPHHPSGFRFGGAPAPEATEADHPSGFRFGGTPAPEATEVDHPSGFRFGGTPAREAAEADHPSGFRFSGTDARKAAEAGPPSGLRFGRASTPKPVRADHPSGFRFGGTPAPEVAAAHHPSGFRFRARHNGR